MTLDKVGVIVILGILTIGITYLFKKDLLKNWGWLTVFGVGGSVYLIISSLFYAITGEFFWKDTLDFYRFVIGIGAVVYIRYIIDLYKSSKNKKSKKSNKKRKNG